MIEFIAFIQDQAAYYVVKGLVLILIAVFTVFSFIVHSRVRALNRTIYLAASNASATIQTLSFIIFVLGVSLFIITLVIV